MKNLMMKRILVAIDFLESSRLSLDYAVAFAHHFNAKVVLIHAVELSPPAEEAEVVTGRQSLSRKAVNERLEAFAEGVRRTGIEVETLVVDGTPCQVILDEVEMNEPDLLVLGVHGIHRGVDHLLIGSNTEKILLTVSCPALSVGAHVFGGLDLDLRLSKIIYCSDLTREAAIAGSYALLLATAFDVPIDIFHLAPKPFDENPMAAQQAAEEYCRALRGLMPEAADLWCTPAFHLEHGFSPEQILMRVEEETSSLVVLGVRAETQLSRHLHTSFVYKLLTRATCPVLSIRAGLNDS